MQTNPAVEISTDPGLAITSDQPLHEPSVLAGTRIGPYKLLQSLGEGGMGTVYLAEQTEPVQRRVAVKIIRSGLGGSGVLGRFEQERQSLALMDHPNIAKFLDAGEVSPGVPYFVMEFVRGLPLTQYCDEQKLPIKERLALFADVCRAVHHSHTKGIVHRDLKPSNILVSVVDGKPIPKIIDFGVAKALQLKLTDRTLFTEIGSLIGTLEYMAPEQVDINVLDIDTRADVYSLGCLLYELLTGEPPFTTDQLRKVPFNETMRLIREVDPPRPSARAALQKNSPAIASARQTTPRQLRGQLRGDLDCMVLKALAKERDRRYGGANEFGVDLTRHLEGLPIMAGPPRMLARLWKYCKKNKSTVWVIFMTLNFACIAFILFLMKYRANKERENFILQSGAKIERNYLKQELRATEARLADAYLRSGDVRNAAEYLQLALEEDKARNQRSRIPMSNFVLGFQVLLVESSRNTGKSNEVTLQEFVEYCRPYKNHEDWNFHLYIPGIEIDARSRLAEFATKRAQYAAAESALLECENQLQELLGFRREGDLEHYEIKSYLKDTRQRLVNLYVAWGKPAETQKWRAKK